jgi:spore germination protein KB
VLVLRAFTEFILMVALPNTPAIAISGVMMAIVIWVVYMGIEVVCRCSLAIIGFVLFETILSVFLMGKDFEFGNLLPVVDRGWAPIMEGMTQLVGFPFGETVLFAMIIPLINKIEQARKTMLWAFLTAGLLLLLVNVRNTLVMGDLLSRMIYPSYTAYQYISIADFIERVEPITIITWLAGGFIKISVCLYVCAKSLSTVFSSKRHRTYLIPLCILMLAFSRFIYRNNTEVIEFATKVWQWYSVPFQIIVPLLMLLTAVILKRKRGFSSKDLAAPEVTSE